MSKAIKAFKYVWRKLNKKGSQFDHQTAENVMAQVLNADMQQPHGKQLRKAAIIEETDTVHESKHTVNGHVWVDPMHAKFKVKNEKDKRITTAHYYYPEPLGGRYVWYSKDSLNGGQSASSYWTYVGPVQEDNDEEKNEEDDGKGKGKGKRSE